MTILGQYDRADNVGRFVRLHARIVSYEYVKCSSTLLLTVAIRTTGLGICSAFGKVVGFTGPAIGMMLRYECSLNQLLVHPHIASAFNNSTVVLILAMSSFLIGTFGSNQFASQE